MDVPFPRKRFGDLPIGAEDWIGNRPAGKPLSERERIGVARQFVEADYGIYLVTGEMAPRGLGKLNCGINEHIALAFSPFQLARDEVLDGHKYRGVARILKPRQQSIERTPLSKAVVNGAGLRIMHQAVRTKQLEQVAPQPRLRLRQLRPAHAHAPGQYQRFKIAACHIAQVPARMFRRHGNAVAAPKQEPGAIVQPSIEAWRNGFRGQLHGVA
jgi:hypothetical protein